MQWHRSGLIATWQFLEEHVERKSGSGDNVMVKPLVEKHSEKKWGAMVIIKSLQLLPTVLTAALRETAHDLRAEMASGPTPPVSHGNMLHIALVGINNQMSLLQDRYTTVDVMFTAHFLLK